MFAIRARRKTVTEKDFLDAVNKVIKGYQKFSATPKYMVYNWVNCFASFLKKNLECSYGLSNWAWYELYGSFGDSVVNFISVFELELASTRIISLIICYRTIVFLWVSPCKIVKVYQTLFCYNIIPWLFRLFWNRCNLLGIWKPLFLTPPHPPPSFFVCLFITLHLD